MKTILSFILLALTINAFSQTYCIKANSDQIKGEQDGYRYELWSQYSQGNACMTLKKGTLFSGYWQDVENYLARRGLSYNQTQEHQEIGAFSVTFNCDYKPESSKGNSYLSVYGWTVDPLIEYYIIEDWHNWNPSLADNASPIGSFYADGSFYDIYVNTKSNKPSIIGDNITFTQYFSIRRNKRTSGTIDISKHFKMWEISGLDLGKLHEVSFVVEGYQNSGSFNFMELDFDSKTKGNDTYSNIRSDAAISYSSVSNGSYKGYRPSAAHTVDGKIQQAYNMWSAGNPPAWISYQFDNLEQINRIEIYGGSVKYGQLKYRVDFLDSNGNWKSLSPSMWINESVDGVERYLADDNSYVYKHSIICNLSAKGIRISVDDSKYPLSHLWRTVITEVKILSR